MRSGKRRGDLYRRKGGSRMKGEDIPVWATVEGEHPSLGTVSVEFSIPSGELPEDEDDVRDTFLSKFESEYSDIEDARVTEVGYV